MDAQSSFRAALELSELTIALRRHRLEREHPEEPAAWIAGRLQEWLLRPGLPDPRAASRER
jgi:hypothetical protein